MKVFGDTVHFIALLSTTDRWHARAIAINRQSPGALVTTEWVLTEVGDTFSHPAARQKFIRLLQLLREQADVEIVPSTSNLFRRGADVFSARPDKEWSLTDCISFVVMNERDINDALTNDHHFELRRPTANFAAKSMPSQSYPWFTFLSNACASAYRPLRSCGEWLRTCTIITGEPNELVAQIHSRMPAILPEQHHAAWLGETDNENLEELLLPYPPDEMGMWEISPRVNSPKNDDASLWESVHAGSGQTTTNARDLGSPQDRWMLKHGCSLV